jgi:uncharacterized protein (DUF2126 family)
LPPWLIDRILRNLLVDSTGNTHRAEFCIDKLYSPDGSTGRLGLLEMRAFEMPPHARMSLAQQLLLRALIARFWNEPYAPPRLVRWGTELHDRFMLPHFVQQDFDDVIDGTQRIRLRLRPGVVRPAFRIPLPAARALQRPGHRHRTASCAGTLARDGRGRRSRRHRALRRLLGRTPAGQGHRHGRRPLHPGLQRASGALQNTGNVGEFVAGVRYRAWQPPSCLHPTIGVHAPLVFDLVDTWMQRSRGGCQYHVAHPGGRNFETYPVNAYEAEGRRLARFSGGLARTPADSTNADFPFTLDLRS